MENSKCNCDTRVEGFGGKGTHFDDCKLLAERLALLAEAQATEKALADLERRAAQSGGLAWLKPQAE